jgi:imidazolonepropionase-like amidohydrolase
LDIAIKGKVLIDGTGAKPVPNPVVLISDGRIKAVGGSKDVSLGPDVGVIDAQDKAILPGLIDGHVHLYDYIWRRKADPWSQLAGDQDDMLLLWCAEILREALKAGITTLKDCGAPGKLAFKLKGALQVGLIPGPRLLVCGPPITTTAGHGDYLNLSIRADNADELKKACRQMVFEGADYIKVMATGGSGDPQTNRYRAQYSAEELKVLVDDAARLNKKVTAHVNGTEGIRNAVQAGVRILAHCNWLGTVEGTLDYDEDVVRKMAEKGIYVDLNGGGLAPLGEKDIGRQDWKGWSFIPKRRWDMMERMRELGVQVFITTDAEGHGVAKIAATLIKMVRETNLSPVEVIRMATQIPAQALEIGDATGTVEVGKEADIILTDGDPSQDMAALERVTDVFRSGEHIVMDRRFAR